MYRQNGNHFGKDVLLSEPSKWLIKKRYAILVYVEEVICLCGGSYLLMWRKLSASERIQ